MAGVRAIKKKIQAFKRAIPALAEDSIAQTKESIIELNQEQMVQGLDRYGNSLGSYKDPLYAAKKAAMFPGAGGRKNYKLTGDYYKGFFASVDGGIVRLGSIDIKASYPSLSGKDFRFGLDIESHRKYISILKPVFFEKSRQVLNS